MTIVRVMRDILVPLMSVSATAFVGWIAVCLFLREEWLSGMSMLMLALVSAAFVVHDARRLLFSPPGA